ncbi:DUF4364 family protein [Clostridiisalibacter paucivorans]|uniref:DUF4364 family protein n=1 Tax=Clostridiisalibacter paucivorans TaxID=408753 RepID=UPI00047B1B0C|nr:DUF4364 family protein [Clostridiisalibacter paucivorans]
MFTENPKELAQNKLILLYILDKLDPPITNTELTQFILENSNINYFLVQQYLSELINANFIHVVTVDDNENYKLSDLGKKTLYYFLDRVPASIKSNIDKKHKERKIEKIKETQIKGNYYKKNDSEYIVNLKVIENNITLFSLSLNVVSNKQAKLICKNWKENPQYIYKEIFDMLIKE